MEAKGTRFLRGIAEKKKPTRRRGEKRAMIRKKTLDRDTIIPDYREFIGEVAKKNPSAEELELVDYQRRKNLFSWLRPRSKEKGRLLRAFRKRRGPLQKS